MKASRPEDQAPRTAGPRAVAKRRLVLLAAALVCAGIIGPLVALATPGGAYAIATGSMEPEVPKGALVIVRPETVDVGDVIAYRSAAGVIQIHRVTEVRNTDEGPRYITRGDANTATDAFVVAPEAVEGVVVASLPYVGHLWLVPRAGAYAALALLVCSYLALVGTEARAAAGPSAAREPATRSGKAGAGRTMKTLRVAVIVAALAVLLALSLPTHALVSSTAPSAPQTLATTLVVPFAYAAGSTGTTTLLDNGASAIVQVQGNINNREVLRQTAPVGVCAWSVSLIAVSGTMGPTGTATVRLSTGTTTVPQIQITNGAITQPSGPPITVPAGAVLEHVLSKHPQLVGTGVVNERADCIGTGIHTETSVTYLLA